MPHAATPGVPIRWRIFMIVALASSVSYMLRANLSLAAPAMIEDLQLSEVQWGYVLAAFTAGYALFQFPGGLAGDRFGPRRMLTLIAVAWAILTALTALIPGTESVSVGVTLLALILVRFLVGAFHAPIFPVINTVIVRWFPANARGLPQGLGSSALTLGFAAAAPLLTWLSTQYGWRASFWLVAPMGLVVAALWWWYGRDTPAEHWAVSVSELELIGAADYRPELHSEPETGPPVEEGSEDAAGAKPKRGDWLKVLRNRDVLLLTLAASRAGAAWTRAVDGACRRLRAQGPSWR
ncbi:MAG: MFS transporter, partial [Pseudomonadota bacterium]